MTGRAAAREGREGRAPRRLPPTPPATSKMPAVAQQGPACAMRSLRACCEATSAAMGGEALWHCDKNMSRRTLRHA
eukprot:12747587-Alexandrium_andersonii.AAC.1